MARMMHVIMVTIFLSLGLLGAGYSRDIAIHNKFMEEITHAHGTYVIEDGVITVNFDKPLVTHCDMVISGFLTSDGISANLENLVIPEGYAIENYVVDEHSTFTWLLPWNLPAGTYALQVYVKADCGTFASGSAATKPIIVIYKGE